MSYGQVNTDIVSDSSGGKLAPISSVFRNRIINGAMVIDQRNAGASTTPSDGNYTLDRWKMELGGGGAYSVQQSTTAPTGFANSMLITVTTADSSIAAGDYYDFVQFIEGFNTADLGFGTANAKTVTLSFWVQSSLTGTFSGSLRNSAANRSYPFTYTISSANTWTQVSATIAGDTTGTWVGSTNGRGLCVFFDLGSGSSSAGTANTWQTGNLTKATGSVNLIATNGATFYITGVQLEVGSSATGFEYRQYTTEFTLCQRYYQKLGNATGVGNWYNNTAIQVIFNFPVIMRTAPTASMTGALTFFDGKDQITETSGQVNDSDLCETGGRCNIGNFPSNTVQYRFYEFASPFSNNRYATFSAEL